MENRDSAVVVVLFIAQQCSGFSEGCAFDTAMGLPC
uniref:Uncharacterized protein n=1 Tax=Anguilla anguilla TaxID=7936 RepID=A0A0E9R539_ANGAN